MIGIYRISCTQESTVYIGSSVDIHRRWYDHKRNLNADNHRNRNLQLAWDAYGRDSFLFEVLELTENIVQKEQYYLDEYWPNCYNISPNAWNPMAQPEIAKKQVESLRKSGKRGGQKLKEEEVTQIKDMLRNKTYTVKEIAKHYEVSIGTIAAIKEGRRWGYVKVEGFIEGTNRTAKDMEPEIIKLYHAGVRVAQIAKELGLKSPSSIYDVLNRNNIQAKRVGTR